MADVYDVEHFELDYCQADILKIIATIRNKASLLAIGMPGCGKSRLIDFLLRRPGVREKYGVPDTAKFVTVDGDLGVTGAQGIFIELLQALNDESIVASESNPDILKNWLITEVRKLETKTDLIVIFDNFKRALQQKLGENFFNFLFALRNIRPKLNISYIFLANLEIDPAGFFKLSRLFDKGPDRSIGWFSLLNQNDTIFSINRQLSRAGQQPDALSQTQKQKILALTGGHALLTRYLTLLILSGNVDPQAEPIRLLEHAGIYAACEAIWHDLPQAHQNFVIDLTARQRPISPDKSILSILQNYGLLDGQAQFFSPIFECFVRLQEKTISVIDIRCDEIQTQLVIKTHNGEHGLDLGKLSQRKRRLLCYLIENQGEPCLKDQLIAVGWPTDFGQGVTDQALSRQIDGIRSWLRQDNDLNQHLVIETRWGEGYQCIVKG